ncbi:MAG: hypothetical protein KBG19_04380 [Bacteroidales bacterium]|nr:hypothetical protein [Bacteroidales bacterium]
MNTAQTLVIAEAVKAIAMASKEITNIMIVLYQSDPITTEAIVTSLQKVTIGNTEISEILKNKGAKVKIDAEPKLKK